MQLSLLFLKNFVLFHVVHRAQFELGIFVLLIAILRSIALRFFHTDAFLYACLTNRIINAWCKYIITGIVFIHNTKKIPLQVGH